jgi:enterochelin esterase-like enzyme
LLRQKAPCNDDDYLTIGNAMLHVALTKRRVPHEYRVRDGAHAWSYWRSGLLEALKFIGSSFHKP